jgi:hypothetical protein
MLSRIRATIVIVKVKCTLVQALRLCTGRTVHRGRRGIALLFHDHGTRRGWRVSVTPRPLFTPGKDPVPIVREDGWAPGPVWTGAENLATPPGFDHRTVQPVAQSLYRLSYPAHNNCYSGKSMSITYSENVFVALVIQHAMRMHRIVICGLSGSTIFSYIFS